LKKVCHTISVALIVILFFGSVAITSVAAKEQGPVGEIKLVSGDPVANAQFGRSVAMAGDLVAVGEGGDGSIGAVYLYTRQGQDFIPEATLDFPDELPDTCPETDVGNCPEFGRSVAIQGNTVFVGARFAPVGELKAGAVYVFRKHDNSWQFVEKIISSTPQAGDNFGRAIAIQGDTLVVTARKENLGANDVGAAYVYSYIDGWYQFQTKITAGDPAPSAYFGQAVALQDDLVVVTARNADPNGAGAFYLFRRSTEGWNELAKVTPADGEIDDQYGFSVAMAGNTIAIGARRANPDTLEDAGAVYLYSVNGDVVEPVTRLTPGDASAKDEFGQSVTIAGDTIAVGAWKDDKKLGAVYLFRLTDRQWAESGKLSASDGVEGDEFGYSLAAFGNRMVTGAHFADARAGAAYVLPLRQLP